MREIEGYVGTLRRRVELDEKQTSDRKGEYGRGGGGHGDGGRIGAVGDGRGKR